MVTIETIIEVDERGKATVQLPAEIKPGVYRSMVVVLEGPGVASPRRSVLEVLDSLPPGPRSASTWDEIERQFQEERRSWDR